MFTSIWFAPPLVFFFLNDTPPTEISPLSLHDALPIFADPNAVQALRDRSRPAARAGIRDGAVVAIQDRPVRRASGGDVREGDPGGDVAAVDVDAGRDRKSTRLNSSHGYISYAVFCLKK